MSKRFLRPKTTAEDRYGLSLAAFYGAIADGTIPLKQIPILDRAVGFDDDEVLIHQLGLIADRDGLIGAERDRWIDEEFIKQKAQAERVAEHRVKTERKLRGMHAKKLVEAGRCARLGQPSPARPGLPGRRSRSVKPSLGS